MSVTLTVNPKMPGVLGVPDMVPEDDKVKPEGSAPDDRTHEYGGFPQAADKVCE